MISSIYLINNEIMTFDQLYNLVLEGMISVPQEIMKPVQDYYLEAYRKFRSEGKKKVSEKSFPPKVIPLDFTGTKWEFLMKDLSTPPSVVVTFTGSDSAFARYRESSPNSYPIRLTLKSPEESLIWINEHEVSHVIQYFLDRLATQKWRKKYKDKLPKTSPNNYSGYSDKFKNPEMVGVPPKEVLPKTDVDWHGRRKGKGRVKRRTEHTLRPIEYYPDLLTTVRDLRKAFETKFVKGEKSKDTEENRSRFFKQFYKELGVPWDRFQEYLKVSADFGFRISSGMDYAPRIMKRFRTMGGKMWQHILKTAYNSFVNQDPNFDAEYIRNEMKKVEEEKSSKDKKKSEKLKEKSLPPQEFVFERGEPSWDWRDFSYDLLRGFDSEGTKIEAYSEFEDYLRDLPFKEIEKDGGDYIVYRAPNKLSGIKKMFLKIKELKTKWTPQRLPSKSDGENYTPDEIVELVDTVFDNVKDAYLTNVEASRNLSGEYIELDQRRKELGEFIDQIYM
jgi:hypothetical protein